MTWENEFDLDALMNDALAGVTAVGVAEAEGESDDAADHAAPVAPAPKGWDKIEGDHAAENADDASGAEVLVPEVIVPVTVTPVAPVAPAAPASVTAAFTQFAQASGAQVQVRQFAQASMGQAKTNLHEASRQWAMRPADERFWTVQEMAEVCQGYKAASFEKRLDLGRVQVVNDGGDMLLMGGGLNGPAKFTHYSFGQLCQTAGAPAGYLRELDGELAAKCLESGLRKKDSDSLGASGNVLVRRGSGDGSGDGGSQRVNAFLSGGYSRIWNADIVKRLAEFESRGWRVPPARPAGFDDPRARAATEDDVLRNNRNSGGLEVKVGDLIAPAGLYASDRDMFAFMVLEGDGGGGGFEVGGSAMNRGFFVWNSEVGDRSFGLTTFMYDAVCGNHIVWGASEVSEIRLIHRGQASVRWVGDLQRALQRYSAQGTEKERKAILAAIGCEIGHDRDAVIEKLFRDKKLGLTKRVLEQAWDWSVKEARLRGNKFSPTSVWGMICGLTRVSQEVGWAGERVAIDQAAGKMLLMAS